MHLPNEGTSYLPAPAGSHVAICVAFIDLGTQPATYPGETKLRRQVQIRWELSDELMTDGRPFTISRKYTWSMHEKATLRKDLEAWRSKPFTSADLGPGGFDTHNLLGVACLLNVIHVTGKTGIYATIDSVSPLPKAIPKPKPPANKPMYLALTPEGFDQAVFASLHEKTQDTIAGSPEYRALMHGPGSAPASNNAPAYDDDIPF